MRDKIGIMTRIIRKEYSILPGLTGIEVHCRFDAQKIKEIGLLDILGIHWIGVVCDKYCLNIHHGKMFTHAELMPLIQEKIDAFLVKEATNE